MINYETVSVKLSPEYIEGLDFVCKEYGISRQDFIICAMDSLIIGECSLKVSYNGDLIFVRMDEKGMKPHNPQKFIPKKENSQLLKEIIADERENLE